MKILYVAYRNDPRDPDAGSGADFGFAEALKGCGHSVEILGPFVFQTSALFRVIKQISRRLRYRAPKFWPTSVYRFSNAVNEAVARCKPDLVFSLFSIAFVHYLRGAPAVVRCDTTLRRWQEDGNARFSVPALRIGLRQEQRAFSKCSRIITHSEYCRESLLSEYNIGAERIEFFPNPAALPQEVLPARDEAVANRSIGRELSLLVVGRDFRRKGVDVAIEAVQLLNERGIRSKLVVCGVEGLDSANVSCVGTYSKKDVGELRHYADLYREADFLIHPARFDPSPIVTSEAAAFGVPVITNDVGGISTSVEDGVSGVVLPSGSNADAYADTIACLSRSPAAYRSLRRSSRRRFERERIELDCGR